MGMHRFLPYLICLLLAVGSFSYGRQHYIRQHSVTLMNPLDSHASLTVTSPLANRKIFGAWVKEERLFALVLPVALLAVGLTLSLKK